MRYFDFLTIYDRTRIKALRSSNARLLFPFRWWRESYYAMKTFSRSSFHRSSTFARHPSMSCVHFVSDTSRSLPLCSLLRRTSCRFSWAEFIAIGDSMSLRNSRRSSWSDILSHSWDQGDNELFHLFWSFGAELGMFQPAPWVLWCSSVPLVLSTSLSLLFYFISNETYSSGGCFSPYNSTIPEAPTLLPFYTFRMAISFKKLSESLLYLNEVTPVVAWKS